MMKQLTEVKAQLQAERDHDDREQDKDNPAHVQSYEVKLSKL